MGIYTREEQLELIKDHWTNLQKIDNQYEEICLEAVKQNGEAIKYVKEQTEEICLEAAKRYRRAIEYIIVETPEICLEAVKRTGKNIELIEKEDLITPEIYFYAFLNCNYEKTSYMLNNINKFIDTNPNIKNQVFCINYNNNYNHMKNNYYYFFIDSLVFLKDFLIKRNSNNKYILDDVNKEGYCETDSEEYLNLLKEIAISNNELIIVDTGNIKDVHKKLANKIITIEELEQESF